MYTIEDIRRKVYNLGKIIDSPKRFLSVADKPIGDGSPHVEIDGFNYHYVISERGTEFSRKVTKDIDELLYWIFQNVVSSMAVDYEKKHRVADKDFRRLLFEKKYQLLEKLNPSWSELEKQSDKETLIRRPFDDDTDKRVSLCKKYVNDGMSAEEAYRKSCENYPEPSE